MDAISISNSISVSMSTFMEDNPGLKYIFFGGKGGVGKTVMAGAAALWSAKKGKKTLLASTNPVHSLSNLFGQDVFGKPVVVCNEERCHAFEIDTRDSYRTVETGDQGKDQLVPQICGHYDEGRRFYRVGHHEPGFRRIGHV